VLHDAIINLCRGAGFTPRIVEEAADWQLLASMVAAGLAVTLAPTSVQHLPREGVRYLPVTPRDVVAQLDLVHPPGLCALGEMFRRAARETAVRAPDRRRR
jgi:DNA-binding transcriptional LysR family regulator